MRYPIRVFVKASEGTALYENILTDIHNAEYIHLYSCPKHVAKSPCFLLMLDGIVSYWISHDALISRDVAGNKEIEEQLIYSISEQRYNTIIAALEDKTCKTINELTNGIIE